MSRREGLIAIFVISLAGLVLEVAYTRVISYKLWYYYTYLVLGLALLGIGSGATLVAVSSRVRATPTRTLLRWSSLLGALSIVAGYCVIAVVPVNTLALWDYGSRGSFGHLAVLSLICFMLFATFISIGVMVAILLARAGDQVGTLYFADLVGAGLGCAVVVYLVSQIRPPGTIMLAALLLAGVALGFTESARRVFRLGSAGVVALLALLVIFNSALPTIQPEASKSPLPEEGPEFSDWGPVFRVDVAPVKGRDDLKWLIHDGTYGSAIHRFDGDIESLGRFDSDPRSWPFELLGEPVDRQLIIGSAGGNEILASLYHESKVIDAVELNPVTVKLVEETYREYTGDLTSFGEVNLLQGDGRSHLARTEERYDLVWFVAPDSYAANNAASSGAFVLSESYLYTAEMIEETLKHLTDDGIAVAQFGEVDFVDRPNRTSRYIVTAREAMRRVGVEDPTQHVLVATSSDPLSGGLSTIVLKRTPFTPDEVERFVGSIPNADGALVYAPGWEGGEGFVHELAGADEATAAELVANYSYDISVITDNGPFFWHFVPFSEVIRDIFEPINAVDRENAVGERVLLLLLLIAGLFAVAFLLLPFLVVRKQWSGLPAKRISALYFAAVGLGFMLYEITMIQRLAQYLGFPTYSLTVTLASILVFTGIGSLLSNRFAEEPHRVVPVLLGALLVLTVFYRLALAPIINTTLTAPFTLRVFVAFLLLAPLGVCLGMFMPLGLRLVGVLTPHSDVYVAWGWAINGVFSVIGSVLTTILSMSFGFHTVQAFAVAAYAVAAFALWRLHAVRSSGAHVERELVETALHDGALAGAGAVGGDAE